LYTRRDLGKLALASVPLAKAAFADENANRCVPASRFFRTNEMPSAWRSLYLETISSGWVRLRMDPAVSSPAVQASRPIRAGAPT
jgi:hypothetical protein